MPCSLARWASLLLVLVLLAPSCAAAQEHTHPSGNTLPSTCRRGSVFVKANGGAGQKAYLCESANTWVLQGSGGFADVVSTASASYAPADSNLAILVDATSSAVTVTLQLAITTKGRTYLIKKIDSSANAVTIARSGADTIDGATTQVISTQYTAVNVISDGSATWWLY